MGTGNGLIYHRIFIKKANEAKWDVLLSFTSYKTILKIVPLDFMNGFSFQSILLSSKDIKSQINFFQQREMKLRKRKIFIEIYVRWIYRFLNVQIILLWPLLNSRIKFGGIIKCSYFVHFQDFIFSNKIKIAFKSLIISLINKDLTL